MYSEMIFGHLRKKPSLEGFQFAESYIKKEIYEKVKDLLTDMMKQHNDLKEDTKSVEADVVDYKTLKTCIKEFIEIIPDESAQPSELIKDKSGLWKAIGTIINACAHNEHISFKDNTVSIEEISSKKTDLKGSAWKDPDDLLELVRDRVDANHKMMKNLSSMKKDSDANEVILAKIETLCTSINEGTWTFVRYFVSAINAFSLELAKVKETKDDTDEDKKEIEVIDYLAEFEKLFK